MERKLAQKEEDLSRKDDKQAEMLDTIIQLKAQLDQKELELTEATTRLE